MWTEEAGENWAVESGVNSVGQQKQFIHLYLRRVASAWFGGAKFSERELIYANPSFLYQMNEELRP